MRTGCNPRIKTTMKKRIGIIGLGLTIACLMSSGCASVKSSLDNIGGAAALVDYSIEELDKAYQKWLVQYEEAGGTIGNDTAVVEEAGTDASATDNSVDAILFKYLVWTYGGVAGGTALLSDPRISAFKVSGDKMSFKWDVDLSAWGLGNDEAGALACLFCYVDGEYRGGKFEWISSSRTTRDFGNIRDGYNKWIPSDLDRAEAYIFVVVSKDGKKRSNVVYFEK